MQRIGVRELRQNASRYLAMVARGEVVEVTDRGRPVARLVPVPKTRWDELVASGMVIPPSEPGDIADLEPLDLEVDLTAELQALRDAERY
jgi:prevent-host-death family protein